MKLWYWPDPFLPGTPQQRKFKDFDDPFASFETMQILDIDIFYMILFHFSKCLGNWEQEPDIDDPFSKLR